MKKFNYKDIRTSYEKLALSKTNMNPDPMNAFEEWFDFAIEQMVSEPNAMVLSTVGLNGRPSSRVVLLKEVQKDGIVFFTNYLSKKGKEIENCPFVSVNLFWHELERQVRIEGMVEKVSEEESDEYFYSRPLESQIGAIVSMQSEEIDNRKALDAAFEKARSENPVRPKHWGGYLIKPEYFEFWQGRANRLHDRICYRKQGEEWNIKRISP